MNRVQILLLLRLLQRCSFLRRCLSSSSASAPGSRTASLLTAPRPIPARRHRPLMHRLIGSLTVHALRMGPCRSRPRPRQSLSLYMMQRVRHQCLVTRCRRRRRRGPVNGPVRRRSPSQARPRRPTLWRGFRTCRCPRRI